MGYFRCQAYAKPFCSASSLAQPQRGEGDSSLPDRLRDRRGVGDDPRNRVRLGNVASITVSVLLAFFFGYALTVRPVLQAGLPFGKAARVAVASDTISIATMEVVDNAFLLVVPGALAAGLSDGLFWWSLLASLAVAFVVTVPVNRWLIARGRGHAVMHEIHAH